jgi:hypothetical protein
MVLDYLNRQKEQPDPDFLREMNWTESELQQFVDRWNQARQLSSSDELQQRLKGKQLLEELGILPSSQGTRSGSGANDAFQKMLDGGGRMHQSESLRKQYDAYRRALEQRGR